ncbi:MAG: LPS export ABC transporter periplasmic protein LptC [Candidatus Coatesbacteria bacterium]|nr:LPS export ABC transporter periplasmic protein LptC [Candidatus Coatesbacteria bacterium]
MKFLVSLILISIIFSCARIDDQTKPSKQDYPDQEMKNFKMDTLDGQNKKWILRAKYASKYFGQQLIKAKDVNIEFYNKKGEHYATLTSDEGLINENTNDMQAIGNVVVTTTKKEILKTPILTWSNRKAKIHSNDRIWLKKGNTITTGIGFETDPDLKDVIIFKDFRSTTTESINEKEL